MKNSPNISSSGFRHNDRLFDAPRDRKIRTNFCTDIVLLDRASCLRCGAQLNALCYRQAALFWSHGYGATLETNFVECRECGWFFLTDATEVKPDRDEMANARGAS